MGRKELLHKLMKLLAGKNAEQIKIHLYDWFEDKELKKFILFLEIQKEWEDGKSWEK